MVSPEPSPRPGQQQDTARFGRQILMRSTSDGPHPLRVLVVDDEPSICRALAMLFNWHGVEVLTALAAASAMAALR